MLFIKILLYAAVAGLFAVVSYLVWNSAHRFVCTIRGQVPLVSSARALRRAVVAEILAHYPDMKTACDIGSGFGGLARKMSRKCNLRVDALENMPLPVAVSWAADKLTRANCRTIWCDAFAHIQRAGKYDIAVAYLGPNTNKRLATLRGRVRVLISLAVPVPGLRAVREVAIGSGYTRYGKLRFPHKIFIYEMDNQS